MRKDGNFALATPRSRPARITNNTNVQELIVAEMGPTLGAHGGAGVVGAAGFPVD